MTKFPEANFNLQQTTARRPECTKVFAQTGVQDAAAIGPSINDLKKELLRKCAVCDRGYGATTGERDLIQSLVAQLSAVSPTLMPAEGIEGSSNIAIRGAWRLVYTSAIDVLSLAANPVSRQDSENTTSKK